MSHKLELIIPGTCVAKARPVVRYAEKKKKFYAFTPKRTRRWATAARNLAEKVWGKKAMLPDEKGVAMTVEFIRKSEPVKRPDIANLIMQIADTLESVGYSDDAHIVEIHAYKKKGKIPMTRVVLEVPD